MVYKLDKTPEMTNPETSMLTHSRFNTYLF